MADLEIGDLEQSDELDTEALKEVCGGRSGISNLRHGVRYSVVPAATWRPARSLSASRPARWDACQNSAPERRLI